LDFELGFNAIPQTCLAGWQGCAEKRRVAQRNALTTHPITLSPYHPISPSPTLPISPSLLSSVGLPKENTFYPPENIPNLPKKNPLPPKVTTGLKTIRFLLRAAAEGVAA
tara:strand:- start:3697 stop:4026 length:330 start_codon:yes stop_codon:yes gene_type:complete